MAVENRISRVTAIGVLLPGLLIASMTVRCQVRFVGQQATDSQIRGTVAVVDRHCSLGYCYSVFVSEGSGSG